MIKECGKFKTINFEELKMMIKTEQLQDSTALIRNEYHYNNYNIQCDCSSKISNSPLLKQKKLQDNWLF